MDKIQEISNYINSIIDSLDLTKEPTDLYQPIKYMLNGGGKRLRPLLLLSACYAFSNDYNKAKYQALAVEMFHNFTLLHDDVMDNSDVRHNRPTVHKKWDEKTAILSGDTMLTLATKLMIKESGEKLEEILDVFNKTAIEIYEGQQYDIEFESREDVTADEYLKMIYLKTSVLLGCALKIGAIIGGAKDEDAKKMYKIGCLLGIGFQLQDDYLDTFGDPNVFGKRIGGDILNAKKTFLLITALHKRPDLLKIIDSDIDEDVKISSVKNAYEKTGADTMCVLLIEKYFDDAENELQTLSLESQKKQFLLSIFNKFRKRNV